jgi:hypothetical protein
MLAAPREGSMIVTRRPGLALLAAALALAAAHAGARPAVADEAADRAAGDRAGELGATRLAAPAHRLVLHALLEIGLSKDSSGSPVSIAPDLWYGVSRAFTIGLVHSSQAATGLLGGAGDGLCLTGEEGGCARLYDRAGLLARLAVASGDASVALEGGVLARSLDPMVLSGKLGLAIRLQLGRKLAAELTPSVAFGLTERDSGNHEVAYVPVSLTYATSRRLALAVQAGLIAPFEDFRNEVVIAMSAGVQVMAGEQTFVDDVFSLPHWLDTDRATYGLDARTLTFGVGRAF